MSISLFSLRIPKQLFSSVSLQLQCIRTAATLKYFHPNKEISKANELYGEDNPNQPPMPVYPYGPNRTYPQADTGLYGGAQVQSGNRISKGRNKGKSLRRWYPNVRLEKVHSEALEEEFTIKITASCMRTIKKCGGLDQYLTGNSPARIKELGLLGWRLRWRVLNSPTWRQIRQEKRALLGLEGPDPYQQTFEEAWQNEGVRQRLIELQVQAWEKLRERNKRFEGHVRRTWNKADKTEHDIKPMAVLMEQSPETLAIPDPPSPASKG